MTAPASKRATHADLAALPDHVVGEIIDGVLYASPRPASRHSLASSALGGELSGPFQRGRGGPGGWWILDEPELHLGDDVLVPDLGGWRRERMPEFPDAPAFTLVPDWFCEVLSPSTAMLDMNRKLPVYMGRDVHHVWVVDPANRLVQVFENQQRKPVLIASASGNSRVRLAPFDALELDVGALWGE